MALGSDLSHPSFSMKDNPCLQLHSLLIFFKLFLVYWSIGINNVVIISVQLHSFFSLLFACTTFGGPKVSFPLVLSLSL